MSNYWADDQSKFMLCGEQTVGTYNPVQAKRYLSHIIEESRETQIAFLTGDNVKAIDGAVDTIVVAIGFLHSMGVDPFKAWNAVHAANMRKVIDGKVYRREDGQIGKPDGWYGPEEDLSKLWNRAEA